MARRPRNRTTAHPRAIRRRVMVLRESSGRKASSNADAWTVRHNNNSTDTNLRPRHNRLITPAMASNRRRNSSTEVTNRCVGVESCGQVRECLG